MCCRASSNRPLIASSSATKPDRFASRVRFSGSPRSNRSSQLEALGDRHRAVDRAECVLAERPADLAAIASPAGVLGCSGRRLAGLAEPSLAPEDVGENHERARQPGLVAELAEHLDRRLGLHQQRNEIGSRRIPVHLDPRPGDRHPPLHAAIAVRTGPLASAGEHGARLVHLADLEQRVSEFRERREAGAALGRRECGRAAEQVDRRRHVAALERLLARRRRVGRWLGGRAPAPARRRPRARLGNETPARGDSRRPRSARRSRLGRDPPTQSAKRS